MPTTLDLASLGAGAELGGWDRTALGSTVQPSRPPRRAWSTSEPATD